LEKLPPNTTAAIQPMDQGVIACIKNHIMDAKTEAVMQRFLAGDEDAHNIEMVEAIQWCKDAWDKVTPETTDSALLSNGGSILYPLQSLRKSEYRFEQGWK
jgi:hypothetical protein